ncbi:MAG: D-glycerate dehydrogenase, partial [Proteobacteria bacterium]|nr:D-glycerate dehydrogenase [Pseudomonadota bacterium]
MIVLSRELPPAMMQMLQSVAEVRINDANEKVLDNALIYCSTALDPVDAELINRFPHSMGLIANIGVGIDNIDLDTARS